MSIPNTLFLREVLDVDESSKRPVFKETAAILSADTSLPIHIQYKTRDGEPLDYPILWHKSAWAKDTESWLHSKARMEREQNERWIFSENVRRIVKALGKEMSITGDPANVYATVKLRKLGTKHPFFVEFLRVKLATTIEEVQ